MGLPPRFDHSRLRQEFITPDRPDRNVMIEWFFRSLKEECVWQHPFQTSEEACRAWQRASSKETPAMSERWEVGNFLISVVPTYPWLTRPLPARDVLPYKTD